MLSLVVIPSVATEDAWHVDDGQVVLIGAIYLDLQYILTESDAIARGSICPNSPSGVNLSRWLMHDPDSVPSVIIYCWGRTYLLQDS